MYPKVNILIPSYNQQEVLVKAIDSALRFEYPNLSVIVCDDNSPLSIDWIINLYKNEKRVKIFRNKINIGMVENYRRLVYELSDAEWLMNLDGDDFYINETFLKDCLNQKDSFGKDRIVFFMGCKALYYPDKNEIVPKPFWTAKRAWKLIKGIDYVIDYYPFLSNFSHSAILYNRSMIGTDLYSFNSLNTDANSFLKLALKGNIVLHNKPVVAWRIHEHNSSKGVQTEIKNSKEYSAMLDVAESIRMVDPNRSKVFRSRIYSTYFERQIYQLWKKKNYKKICFELVSDRKSIKSKWKTIANLLFKQLKITE
ncbi:glycosyltransferase family 2 protein [Pseudocnuella soli]|uniref:glycosyltransferase family 2 protein n=1 Tax=Pseudocnuella soli TaxID=2502779 RepID=UPI0010525C6A|nr:glycosyltransferase family 2 protein [Pseudocnuella soli]